MSRQEVLSKLQAQRAALHERFGVVRLTLFGSVARDEALLGCAVDLGTPQSLKPRLRARVLAEAVHVAASCSSGAGDRDAGIMRSGVLNHESSRLH